MRASLPRTCPALRAGARGHSALSRRYSAYRQAPTTTAADHQAIIRQLVERVEVTLNGATEHVALTLYWAGGHTAVSHP